MSTKDKNHEEILNVFIQVVPKTFMKVLLIMKAYFQTRSEKLEKRSFFFSPKGE